MDPRAKPRAVGAGEPTALAEAVGLTKRFATGSGLGSVAAIDGLTARIAAGHLTGLVGPDGAGKTTLIRLLDGLLHADAGQLTVCGLDPRRDADALHRQVSYMPQRFGLYEDLTVRENLILYADLRGVTGPERRERQERLLSFTGLERFNDRLAGKLSGGMKQKLGLACALIRRPRLLLLDEPSVGVDPISRRELWRMVAELVEQGIGVVWSTAYLDEAERCASVLLLDRGRVLFQGPPRDLTERVVGRCFLVEAGAEGRRKLLVRALKRPEVVDGVIQGDRVRLVVRDGGNRKDSILDTSVAAPAAPRFEDAFVDLLGGVPKGDSPLSSGAEVPRLVTQDEAVIEARELNKTFGRFTAADRISFRIGRGEVFGLLGPNGAGKSTTFKMMCGLLRPTGGTARVAGFDLYRSSGTTRARLGYMAQKFSVYGDLSVRQNLDFFAGVYGLSDAHRREQVGRMIEAFGLGPFLTQNAGALPLGFKQRLALACAVMHEPAVLFLDEPTSGVDPLTRREFWSHINAMVQRGVTIMVTTHFMDEAESCDRIGLVYQGRLIAEGSPDALKSRARSTDRPDPTLEDAFIHLVETSGATVSTNSGHERVHEGQLGAIPSAARPSEYPHAGKEGARASLRRVGSLLRKETLQIIRDPSSYLIAVALPLILLFLFAYGVSLDLKRIPIGLVIERSTPETQSLVSAFRNDRYFTVTLARTRASVEDGLVSGRLRGVVVLASDFARQLGRGEQAPVQLIVDGSDPNTAALVQGYVQGVWSNWLEQESIARASLAVRPRASPLIALEPRYWFNPELRSQNFLIPGAIAINMTLIGTLLTALVVAREWERGTMEALMSTPISAAELIVGKLVPYFVMGMTATAISVALAVFVHGVPFRGSVVALLGVSAVFLIAMLALGLLISTLTRNQFNAHQVAMIAAFLPAFELSGFLFEIDSMPLPIRILTRLLPARYFVSCLQTIFLAGDLTEVLVPDTIALAIIAGVLIMLLVLATRKRLD